MRPPRGRGDRGGRFSRGGRSPGRGGRFGGRGGRGYDEGPPAEVVELGSFVHAVEGEMLYKMTHSMVPYFNAGAYLENKTKIGKVDEILGPINAALFTVKPDSGVNATSFQDGDKVYIGPEKLLPMSRFTGEGGRGGGRGGRGGRGGARGGRAGGRGGFGGRGGGRGGFGGRGGRMGGRGGFGGRIPGRGGGRGGFRGRGRF